MQGKKGNTLLLPRSWIDVFTVAMSLPSYFFMSHNQCQQSTQLKLLIARYSSLKSENHTFLEVEGMFRRRITARLLHFYVFSGYLLIIVTEPI